MIPTLKKNFEVKQQTLLENIKKNPELLREAINDDQLENLSTSLKALDRMLSDPAFNLLKGFRSGIQQASDEMLELLNQGPVRSWVSQILPDSFTTLGRIAAFQTGIGNTLRQLPKIANVVRTSLDSGRGDGSWDPDAALSSMLDVAKQQKVRKIILNSLRPPGLLGWLKIKGIPYINDEAAANQILKLSFTQMKTLSDVVTNSANELPPKKADEKTLDQIKNVAVAEPEDVQAAADVVLGSKPQDAQDVPKSKSHILPDDPAKKVDVPSFPKSPPITLDQSKGMARTETFRKDIIDSLNAGRKVPYADKMTNKVADAVTDMMLKKYGKFFSQ